MTCFCEVPIGQPWEMVNTDMPKHSGMNHSCTMDPSNLCHPGDWQNLWPQIPAIMRECFEVAMSKKEAPLFPLRKGLHTRQAHVDLPAGTFEEEHARQGFYGRTTHLYRLHPVTGWTRIEGPLRPRSYDLNQLLAADGTGLARTVGGGTESSIRSSMF